MLLFLIIDAVTVKVTAQDVTTAAGKTQNNCKLLRALFVVSFKGNGTRNDALMHFLYK